MNFKSSLIFVDAHSWGLFIFYGLFDSHHLAKQKTHINLKEHKCIRERGEKKKEEIKMV